MPTVSEINQEEFLEVAQPDEDIMFNPTGRDRRGIRYDFSPVQRISASDRYVTKGDAPFVHPDSDLPFGDSGIGESTGSVEIVIEEGEPTEVFRFTHGFSVDLEDEDVDPEYVSRRRDAILHLFDLQADVHFFNGVDDGKSGTELREGVLQWLDDNTTATIDASTHTGIPANIIANDAYSNVTGEYVDNAWGAAIANHSVWSNWNTISNNSGAGNSTEWSVLDTSEGVSVNRRIGLPDNFTLRTPPSMSENIQIPLEYPTATDGADDDVMWLLPNHGGDFFRLYEMGTPITNTVDKEGFRRRVEYLWRYGTVYDNSFKAASGEGTDIIKIENVSTMF